MNILERLAFMEIALLEGQQSFSTWAAIEHLRRIRSQFLGGERPPGQPPIPALLPVER